MNKILDEYLSNLEAEANHQGIDKEKLLSELVKRSEMKWKPKKESTISSSSITVQEATSLIYNLDLSINKYQVHNPIIALLLI